MSDVTLATERERLVRAYEALVGMANPPTYQVWTLAEKALRLAHDAEAEVERLRQTLSHLLLFARGNEHVLGIIHDALDAPEPEWEYRAVGPDGHELVMGGEDKARDIAWLMRGRVERRRKAGEWEALPDAD